MVYDVNCVLCATVVPAVDRVGTTCCTRHLSTDIACSRAVCPRARIVYAVHDMLSRVW